MKAGKKVVEKIKCCIGELSAFPNKNELYFIYIKKQTKDH